LELGARGWNNKENSPLLTGSLAGAKFEGEKKRNYFSRAALEVSLSGRGRLPGQRGNWSCLLAARIRTLHRIASSSSHAGAEPGLRAKGGRAENK